MKVGEWSGWPAPAKLNLFLQIIGRRDDGLHGLQTVFRLLDWGDTVYVRLRDDGVVARVGESVAGVGEDDDLAVRAGRLLQSAAGIKQGVDIRLEKRIPAGGGFGGGSSDAATILVVLNKLWGAGLDVDALAVLGLQLGADVPVFVRGYTAWGEGVGEVLTPIYLPDAWYILVNPGVHVATGSLFESKDLTREAEVATIAGFLSGTLLGNVFEPVLRSQEPKVNEVFEVLSRIGKPRLTGTGSGCFVEFATLDAAQQAMKELPAELDAWVVKGVEYSPLLDMIAK